MLAGVVSPPMVVAGAANLGPELTRYLVSAALIACGFLSMIQITRFHIRGTPYVFLGIVLRKVRPVRLNQSALQVLYWHWTAIRVSYIDE